jgi:hypothetical protein
LKAEHVSAEFRIVKISRQCDVKAIDPERAANQRRFREIHADRSLRRHHLNERTAILCHDNTLTARRAASAASAKRVLASGMESSMLRLRRRRRLWSARGSVTHRLA